MAAPASYFDPKLITQLSSLRLRAAYIADGLVAGGYLSKRYGSSIEFADHKQYTPGDEAKHIDWKLHARTDRYFVRRFEDESNRNFQFVLDCSGSMNYQGSSGSWTKWQCAATVVLSLATVCLSQGDAVGWLLTSDAVYEINEPTRLQHVIVRLDRTLESLSPRGQASLPSAITTVGEILRRRACVVVFSDLLDPLEKLESALNRLLYLGHQVILFQILDQDEISFQFNDGGRFVDLENGSKLSVDPLLVRDRYLALLKKHNAELDALIYKLNDLRGRCALYRLNTSQPLAPGVISAFERTASYA